MFGAGTSTFRQLQNRRILARHALKFRICPGAKSACSGVGGVAKWRGEAQGRLAMERHHRGSQRDIIPRPAAATLLFVLVTVFRFTLRAAEIFLVVLGKECLHTVFAELQAGGFVCQHEAEHHLDRQQRGMKIPKPPVFTFENRGRIYADGTPIDRGISYQDASCSVPSDAKQPASLRSS